MADTTKKYSQIIAELQRLSKNPSSSKAMAKAVLQYHEEKGAATGQADLFQFGIKPGKALARVFLEIRNNKNLRENVVVDETKRYLKDYEKSRSHKDRRESLHKALKLLTDKNLNRQPDSLALLARVYLYRSRIIRPRGRTVPERKKEALRKGLESANKAIGKEPRHEKGLRVKG